MVINKSANPAKISKLNAGSVEEALTSLHAEAITNFDLYLNVKAINYPDINQRLEALENSVHSLEILQKVKASEDEVIILPADNLGNSEKPESKLVKMELIDKKLSKASAQLGRFQDKMCFALKIYNLTPKTVRAVKGDVVFSDLFNTDIFRVTVTINQKISPQGEVKWDGEMVHNKFIPAHVHFAGFTKDDLKVRLDNEDVIFA